MTELVPTPTEEKSLAEDTARDGVTNMSEMKQSILKDDHINIDRVFWGAVILTIVGISSFVLGIFMIVQEPVWQVYGVGLIATVSMLINIACVVLIRRGRTAFSLKLLFLSGLVTITLNTILLTNVTALLIGFMLLVSLGEIFLLFPKTWRNRSFIGPVVALAIMLLAEYLEPSFRLDYISEVPFFGQIMMAFMVVAFIVVILRQAWSGNIRLKIVTAFTIVALASLGILGTVTYINYRSQVREDIRQRLLNIVSITAIQQDGDLHASLQTAEANQTEVYQQMVAINDAILATDPDLEYVYTMRLNEAGQIEFVLDSGVGEDYERVDVGYVYEDPSQLLAENIATLDHPIVEEEFYSDEWGTFLSAYAPIYKQDGTVNGVVGVDITADKVVAQERAVLYLILGTTAVAMVIVTLLGLWLGNVFTRPILNLASVAQQVAEGDLSARSKVETTDEIGNLAAVFNTMTSQLQETLAGLEQRVAERTQNLELAAEVGRSVSQVRDLEVMLRDACDLIQKEFDLYYVQVYLTDPSQTRLVLEAGTGEVGAQLRARGHSLQLNTGSINGRAAVEKRTVVISDTAQSATFQPNQLLPDTHGEMAVPLIVGGNVVGVLDMQTTVPGVLNEEVLPAFEALAGQLAVAIQNANLVAEAEEARAEVEAQARRLVRAGWDEHLDAIHKPEQFGFVFDRNEVTPLEATEEAQLPEDGRAVSAPISLTGEMLGSLVVEIDDERRNEQTSELVNTVARQVAQQLENLRLLESSERFRFEAEQAARRQTREGWQEYMKSRAEKDLGYLYDLNEVRPHSNGKDDPEALTLPLKASDETVGKLSVKGLKSEDKESFDLANAVAERLAAHIENLRLSEQTRQALAQSERLFDASRNLTQSADLQGLVEATVKTLDIPVVNRALLLTFEYDSEGEVEQLTVVGNWWNETGHEVTPIGTRYSQDVVQLMPMFVSPTPVFFNDAYNDERVDATTMELVKKLNLRAVGVLPLHLGEHQIGALLLEAEEVHNFTPDEIRLFESLAPQIATILENRQQYERAQRQADREAMLNAINQKIQSATSVEAVLQIAARELGHALGAPMTIAQLSMKDQKN